MTPRRTLWLALLAGGPCLAQDLRWLRQIGTTQDDHAYGIAIGPAGDLYIGGDTRGTLGAPTSGGSDALLAKYAPSGALIWMRQPGSGGLDFGYFVAADSDGSVYLTGTTRGDLAGTNAGGNDAFLLKYDASGALVWGRQIGTSVDDEGYSVAVDGAGAVYICGYTSGPLAAPQATLYDVFVAKYDSAGTLAWIRQLATPQAERAYAVIASGAGAVYVGGYTYGALDGVNAGGQDAFLARYDDAGNLVWVRQFGSAGADNAFALASDGAAVIYVTGTTDGSLGGPSAGSYDAYLARFDDAGNRAWVRQLGTSGQDDGYAVGVDPSGQPVVAGTTSGNLGTTNPGTLSAYMARFDAAGTFQSARTFGTSTWDYALTMAIGPTGRTYLAGYTFGSLGGPNAGAYDIFVSAYGEPCYANCDGSSVVPFINVADFSCFLNRFGSGDTRANCDGSTTAPILNVADFACFLNEFAAGCP